MRRARLVRAAGALAFAACLLAGRPARAQNDLSGEWANLLHEDVNHRNDAIGGGPRIGDYTGLPINDAARRRADSWDAAINTLHEHQTIFAPPPTGPAEAEACGSPRSWTTTRSS